MPIFIHNQKLPHPNQHYDNDDDDDALSLSNLPIDSSVKQEPPLHSQSDFDFDFGRYNISAQTQMSAADDLFFRGQMLPLRRHSVSSDIGLSRYTQNPTRLVSRSESMDHYHSGGYYSSFSSRSSSSSSGTGTNLINSKIKIVNQFHSHPSPNPKLWIPTRKPNSGYRSQKSNIWSFFQLGLLKTPEIELTDLKLGRGHSCNLSNSFSSRNSTESGCTSSVSSNEKKVREKKKNGLFGKNGGLFGGCKCSIDAIETIKNKKMVEKTGEERECLKKKKKKQAVTRQNRTFEWLKQLSVEGGDQVHIKCSMLI